MDSAFLGPGLQTFITLNRRNGRDESSGLEHGQPLLYQRHPRLTTQSRLLGVCAFYQISEAQGNFKVADSYY